MQPLSQPLHLFKEDRVRAELENIPDIQVQAYKLIIAAFARSGTPSVSLSPMGQTTYTTTGWTLISTMEGWAETSYKRWSGVLELAKKGAAF